MSLLFLALLLVAGCDREPEPPNPDPYLDPESSEGKALEAAFCLDVDAGLAMLAEVEDPQIRDFLLYQAVKKHDGAEFVLCRHIENDVFRRRCDQFITHPHTRALLEGEERVDCPAITGSPRPSGTGWCPCSSFDPRPGSSISARMLGVDPPHERQRIEKLVWRQSQSALFSLSYRQILDPCPCSVGSVIVQMIVEGGQVRELSVRDGTLNIGDRLAYCGQVTLQGGLREPPFSGTFTVEYIAWTTEAAPLR